MSNNKQCHYPIDSTLVEFLYRKAQELRITTLKMIYQARSGHLGGSFSIAEIIATLYYHQLRLDIKNSQWPDRDRVVLSKGHAAPIVYAALADLGFIPQDTLGTLRTIGSILQGHPDMRKTSGIDMTTGSLGEGLSAGIGMALAARLDHRDYHVWVLLGDGEIQEGQVWEAASFASFHRLNNLTAIVDLNHLQLDGPTEEILSMEPVKEKWEAFGWRTLKVNGHSVEELLAAYKMVVEKRAVPGDDGRPFVILAETVKGKGVSFMEKNVAWHGGIPDSSQYEKALEELTGVVR